MEQNISFFEDYVFKKTDNLNRYTQDSPILPEVWAQYFLEKPNHRVDLILKPHKRFSSTRLLIQLRKRLLDNRSFLDNQDNFPWDLACVGETVAAKLSFTELIELALPMTNWWQNYLWKGDKKTLVSQQVWFSEIINSILWFQQNRQSGKNVEELISTLKSNRYEREFNIRNIKGTDEDKISYPLWSVNLNRSASLNIYKSNATVKADAARRLFNIDGRDITWAVIDSGIDATHEAFRNFTDGFNEKEKLPFNSKKRQPNNTRVIATYDFTRLRHILVAMEKNLYGLDRDTKVKNTIEKKLISPTSDDQNRRLSDQKIKLSLDDLERNLASGRIMDWSIIAPLIRIPQESLKYYEKPNHPHGTHVAGILGADGRGNLEDSRDELIIGMCPSIKLYDLRVFDKDGNGDEFGILAALQFIRWLNRQQDLPLIHGVNLSMSLIHKAKSYGCGRTPVCDECNRLVSQGTVVVAAAGNLGQSVYTSENGSRQEGYRGVSITDPGNAESVITVGSTHRNKPHTYGVSYFSSRGPTGDGRLKPDLVAPGEKIVSTYSNNGEERLDGTSMSAPHVSGVAALLLSKNRELIGNPRKIKEILCNTAIDLGRERYFQGHGLVDALAALQSI